MRSVGASSEVSANGVPGKARSACRAPCADDYGCSPPPGYVGGLYVELSSRLNWVWHNTLSAAFGGASDQRLREGLSFPGHAREELSSTDGDGQKTFTDGGQILGSGAGQRMCAVPCTSISASPNTHQHPVAASPTNRYTAGGGCARGLVARPSTQSVHARRDKRVDRPSTQSVHARRDNNGRQQDQGSGSAADHPSRPPVPPPQTHPSHPPRC